MAVETGSDKTGVFCLFVIQIVQESLTDGKRRTSGTVQHAPRHNKCGLFWSVDCCLSNSGTVSYGASFYHL